MPSESSVPEEDLLPFGAPEGAPVAAAGINRVLQPSAHKQKVRRSPRALRPLWYSTPVVVIVLSVCAYLIGLTLWSLSSLGWWQRADYASAQAGYEQHKTWTSFGVERWVAYYNLGTTLIKQDRVDEGVEQLQEAYRLVPKAIEVQPGRLEPFSYECRVRVNLAIGFEIQGDRFMAAGSHGDAANAYKQAEETVSPCQSASDDNQSKQSCSKGQSGESDQSDNQPQSQEGHQPGEQSDNPADGNKSRVEDKKQKAEQQSDGQEDGEQREEGKPDDENDPNSNPNPNPNPNSNPSPSPSENPYEGESEAQKKRREALQGQNEKNSRNQRERRDEARHGNPNGAW